MASTYTALLRLEMMATGDQSGTWGVTNNTNIGTLLEAAVAGRAAVSIPSDANYTLTALNGATDEARQMILNIASGVSLTATRNVICPTSSKLYVVKNATTGGQSIVLKTSGGTGITIANGATMLLFCDGTNVVEALSAVGTLTAGTSTIGTLNVTTVVGGSLTLSTPLAIAQGGTGQTSAASAVTALGAVPESVATAKGQVLSSTGSGAVAPVTVAASDGLILTSDSTQSTGVLWTNAYPTGAVIDYAGTAEPTGWLFCYGQAVSRSTYATLFAITGTVYGVGDGATTFNLPDLRGRSTFGRDDMGGSASNRITNAVSGITGTTLGAAGGDQNYQQHTHSVTDPGHTHTMGTNPSSGGSTTVAGASGVSFSASTNSATTGVTIANSGTGGSANVPPAFILNKIIKT